jgi:hypothetical protein
MDDLITSKSLTPHDEILPLLLFSILAPTPRHALLMCLVSPGKGMGEGPRQKNGSVDNSHHVTGKDMCKGFFGVWYLKRNKKQANPV